MGRLQDLYESDFNRAHAEDQETIVRRIYGSTTRTENVQAVIERDSRAAGLDVSRGGLEQTSDRQQEERAYLVEVAASQESHHDDTYVIDNEVWKMTGIIGSDSGSKTFQVILQIRQRGRKSSLNRIG